MRAESESVDRAPLSAALTGLLAALDLEPVGDDRFRVAAGSGLFGDRVFGGQLLGQALVAAGRTVSGKQASSLHALFVEAGDPEAPVELEVRRLRDGRTMSMREVTISQGTRVLMSALASFHVNEDGADTGLPAPVAPDPHDLPLLQEWAADLGRAWIETPPPLEVRMGEKLTFLGGSAAPGPRSHWMRLPRDVGDDPLLHAALLAYASDFFLMDVVFRAHPAGAGAGRWGGFSVDHAIWLHRAPRFDRWHLHTQEAVAIVGDRGVARGVLHDEQGQLVASVTQEIVIRPMGAR